MNALIIDKVSDKLFSLLNENNISFKYYPDVTVNQLLSHDIIDITLFDILIVRNKIINKELILSAKNLKYIGRAGAGLDNIDLITAAERNIKVFNAAEANADSVGEHTLGMLLSLFHKIGLSHQKLKQFNWDREGGRGIELNGKVVSIIGFGNMGSAFAKRLQGFGCMVQFYDLQQKNNSNVLFAKQVDLQTVFDTSDVISLHIPLNAENYQWVNSDFVSKMKKNFYLLNIARGEVLESDALINGLKTGKILGACLDVYENEDLKSFTKKQREYFEFLVKHEQVIFTPHVAGWSVESFDKISEVLGNKLVEQIKKS